MDPEIRRSVSSLFRKFLLLQALIFAAALALSLVFTAHFKQRLAGQLASASRDPLLAGDARQVIAVMPASMSRDFSGMSWLPAESGQPGFSVPAGAAGRRGTLRSSVREPLFYDDEGRFKAGDLVFYYSRLQAMLLALAAWLAVFLITLPVAFLERARLVRDYNLLLDLRIKESYASLAAQVAHDIRSPLAALGAAARRLEKDGTAPLINRAVERIQEITDDLAHSHGTLPAPGAAAPVALDAAVGRVIEEKRLQYSEKPGVNIVFSPGGRLARARVEPKELRRAVSNLVNNAVEALTGPGTVTVSVSAAGGRAAVSVKDDGKGVPPELLARLGRKGETHGKENGSGLGLYHARSAAERWGGSLAIVSAPGEGTEVRMELPAEPPAAARAALLDDDPLVHMTWRMAAEAAGVDLKAFKAPAELLAALRDLPKDTAIYIDSDLQEGAKGEETAAALREAGYTDITMATGHPPEKFAALPWLKVAGKEPPWN